MLNYRIETAEIVDIPRLEKELIELSQFADPDDPEKLRDLRYLIENPLDAESYAIQVGNFNSLVVALSLIRKLRAAE